MCDCKGESTTCTSRGELFFSGNGSSNADGSFSLPSLHPPYVVLLDLLPNQHPPDRGTSHPPGEETTTRASAAGTTNKRRRERKRGSQVLGRVATQGLTFMPIVSHSMTLLLYSLREPRAFETRARATKRQRTSREWVRLFSRRLPSCSVCSRVPIYHPLPLWALRVAAANKYADVVWTNGFKWITCVLSIFISALLFRPFPPYCLLNADHVNCL